MDKDVLLDKFPNLSGQQIGLIFKSLKGLNCSIEEQLAFVPSIIDGTFSSPKKKVVVFKPNSAFQFLMRIDFCPSTQHGFASNNEKRRMLEQRAVKINGKFPKPEDEIEFPIWECVFFPNGVNKVTIR